MSRRPVLRLDSAPRGDPRRRERQQSNWIHCLDGFKVSVVTGAGVYCTPRPDLRGLSGNGVDEDYRGPFTHAEVGFPSERPEPWDQWLEYCDDPDKPTETVYGYVPAELIRALIAAHGGERT